MVTSTSTATAGTGTAQSKAMVTKAFFQVVDGGGTATEGGQTWMPKRLECAFNPTTLQVSGGADWSPDQDQAGGRDVSSAQFSKTKPRTMSVELLFDDWGSPQGSVVKEVDTLFAWTRPRKYTGDTVRPPYLRFQWGTQSYFQCYLTSVSATYKLFRQDGTPVRATVSVSLTEVVDPAGLQGQNPTSGGVTGRRTHLVAIGDSLHTIAYGEYGRAELWRGLAAYNGIDDPLRVSTGDSILLPPVDEAAALS